MALSKAQQTEIDKLIFQNKKTSDIVDELVGKQQAITRDVQEYVKSQKTLQGALKTITHRTKDIANAGDEASRTAAAKEVEILAKKVIKAMQNQSKE